LPIAWVIDDFAESRLWGTFDVIVDRGCLHCLPRARWQRYAEHAARLLAPRGALLLKQHAPGEGERWGTHRRRREELAAVFARDFDVANVTPSTFAGTQQPPPRAMLYQLSRK